MTVLKAEAVTFLLWLLYINPVVSYSLHSKTACFNFPIITDPPCADTEIILPRKFFLGISANSICHTKISSNTLHGDVNSMRYCCQQRDSDKLREYCLPSMKSQIKLQQYHEFLNTCTGRRTCALYSGVQPFSDYATFQYECIPKINILRVTENKTTTDKTVFLCNDQPFYKSGKRCIAYSTNCEATLTIKLVASIIPSNHCSIRFTENTSQSLLDCAYITPQEDCQPTYTSASNYVDMHINMTSTSDARTVLWLKVEGSTTDKVTVTCGDNVPNDVAKRCAVKTTTERTTTTTIAATSTTATTAATTIITNTTHVPSITMETAGITSPYTTLPTIIGITFGVLATIVVISIAVVWYRRRLNRRTENQYVNSETLNSDSPSNRNPASNPYYHIVSDSMEKEDYEMRKARGDNSNDQLYENTRVAAKKKQNRDNIYQNVFKSGLYENV